MKSAKNINVMPKRVFAGANESYRISPEQFKFYEENGYLVIAELIDFATLYGCKQRFIQISKGLIDPGFMTVFKEPSLISTGAMGEDLINKVQTIVYDDIFMTYTENPRLLDVLSQFIGDNITAVHSMLINKPPGTGRHPPHQDLHYFPFRPANKIIAAWTAIDHVTLDNGCLYVVPGSHKHQTLYEHGYLPGSSNLYHGILAEETVAPSEKRQHLEMNPGDTVFFHPLLVHGSGPNVSKHYRKAISCHYANSACEFIPVRGSQHEHLAKEVEQEIKRKGFNMTYTDLYRYQNKLVKGVKCNL